MSNNRPNILLIVADDLGYGDIAHFGNRVVRTPHIDRLAQEGATLTQHYAASPLCAPSRAALLTGMYNHRTGAVDVPSNRGLDRIDPRCRTLADIYKRAGYATGLVGKWHNGLHDMAHHPNAKGFDEFAGFLNGGMDYYNWALDYNGVTKHTDGRHLTDVFTEEACAFVNRHHAQPFFLMLAYNAPHTPLQAPEDLVKRYRDDNPDLNEAVCTIYAMVEQMDAGIGRVLDTLQQQGVDENTIVLFTSDNGPMLWAGQDRYNGPFRGMKQQVQEGGIRVPGIVRYPAGLQAGLTSNHMVHFCDYMPTLANMTGIALPDEVDHDGYDITSRLRGQKGDVPDVRYWQRNRYEPIPRCNGAMRDGPWKLFVPMRHGANAKDKGDNDVYQRGITEPHWLMDIDLSLPDFELGPPLPAELYNLDDDPHEDVDLAAQHPDRVATMTRSFDAWFEKVDRERRDAWSRTRGNG